MNITSYSTLVDVAMIDVESEHKTMQPTQKNKLVEMSGTM